MVRCIIGVLQDSGHLKYMKAMISYDNVTRIETYPLPKAAAREAVYNAIIHSNYAALVPIQIRIHEDAVYISNDCVFPVGWTVETLMERHRSQPYNPNIANGFSGRDMWKHGDAW